MRESLFETLVGLAVIVVAGFFLVFSLSQQSGASTGDNYTLVGKFGRADGVGPGTDVRIAGVKVGAVTSVDVDPKSEVNLLGDRSVFVASFFFDAARDEIGRRLARLRATGSGAELP